MVQVRVNGQMLSIPVQQLNTFADLIELVKSSIDPEHMVTLIHLDGRDLRDQEWAMPPAQLQGEHLDFQSGRPEIYVAERLQDASSVVRSCFFEFRDARKGFQDGDTAMGNQRLKVAVETLKAFFEWYGTLLQLVPEGARAKLDISQEVLDISETCKKIVQQQLYQSWWALGESLEKDLEPKLDKLEDTCRKVAREAQGSANS